MSTGSSPNEREVSVSAPAMSINPDQLRAFMRHWPSGVTVVTALNPDTGTPCGMTVSTFTSLSLEPPLVSVFLHKDAETAQTILASEGFGVSILAADQVDLSNRFAGFDPHYEEQAVRFADLTTHTAHSGAPLLSEALGWMDCSLWAVYDGSTHHIIVGEVMALASDEAMSDQPLVYHNRNYHRLTRLED